MTQTRQCKSVGPTGSFEDFMAAGAKDWYREQAEGQAVKGSSHE